MVTLFSDSKFLLTYHSKELRNIVDQGKKEIKSGIIMACCTYEGKVGVAIGVTDKLVEKFDAIKLVKEVQKFLVEKEAVEEKILLKLVELIKIKLKKLLKL